MKELSPHIRKRLKKYKKGESPYIVDWHTKLTQENYSRLKEYYVKRGNVTELINIAISELLVRLEEEEKVIEVALKEYYEKGGEKDV